MGTGGTLSPPPNYIGIDDTFLRADNILMSIKDLSTEIAALYSRVFLCFYRRKNPRGYRPSSEALAVMEHLHATGPLTVTEAALHLDRSQSAVSELIERLVKRGLLTRIPDERDRRRTLVWLSPEGAALLQEERQVLDHDRLEHALGVMTVEQQTHLTDGLRALIDAAQQTRRSSVPTKRRKK